MKALIEFFKLNKIDFLYSLLIFVFSFLLVADLFLIKGHGVTFDGPTHITNMALFHRGLSEGEIRVTWGDGFANYGLPMPLMVQQTTSYLGAFLTFITQDVILSYNTVYLLGAFLSSLFFYFFLRIYFLPTAALLGSFLFNFAPYRLVNIYTRGALPEFFASVFIPLILIGIYFLIVKKNRNAILLLAFSVSGIILTHPFLFVIAMFIIVPYGLIEIVNQKEKIRLTALTLMTISGGVGATAWYLFPLFGEIKYFFYGLEKNGLKENQFLPISNLFSTSWDYFSHIPTRGYTISPGILELVIIVFTLIGMSYLVFKNIHNLPKLSEISSKTKLVLVSLFLVPIILFLSLEISEPIYRNINLLAGIQYPWRMYSLLIFIPPIFLTYIFSRHNKYRYFIAFVIIVAVSTMRFGELYTKNNVLYPQSNYYRTLENLHGSILNTVWTKSTESYPVMPEKIGVLEGEGDVKINSVKNSSREYFVEAKTAMRLIDYTFFFPGWKVYVDGKETPIEFQDVSYRGVITYRIPEGKHTVEIKFIDTRIRKYGYLASGLSVLFLGFLYIVDKRKNIFKLETVSKI